MPPKKKKSSKKKVLQPPSLTAISYNGPIIPSTQPSRDDMVVTLAVCKESSQPTSSGDAFFQFFPRYGTAGSIPAAITSDFFVSVADAPDFATYATVYTSFRVLAGRVSILVNLEDTTSSTGSWPLLSTVVRSNKKIRDPAQIMETPEGQFHRVTWNEGVCQRSIKMLGQDESEWVDSTNVLSAISPQPYIGVAFLEPQTNIRIFFINLWTVQFRGRI